MPQDEEERGRGGGGGRGGFAFGGRQAAVRWVVIKKSLASA